MFSPSTGSPPLPLYTDQNPTYWAGVPLHATHLPCDKLLHRLAVVHKILCCQPCSFKEWYIARMPFKGRLRRETPRHVRDSSQC